MSSLRLRAIRSLQPKCRFSIHSCISWTQSFRRNLSTLDRNKLTDSDVVHLTANARHYLYKPDGRRAALVYAPRTAFPNNTKGFLYFNPAPTDHPAGGALRFRVTDGSARKFDDGHDLIIPSGEPWSVHISRISRSKRYDMIADLLVQDGFATPQLLEQLRVANPGHERASNIIWSTHQPFLWDLSKPLHLHVAHGEKLLPLRLYGLLSDRRGDNQANYHPFRGLVRGQFEAVEGGPLRISLVIRVLDVLEPVRLVWGQPGFNVSTPAAGELIKRAGKPIVLRTDSDASHAPLLRALAGTLDELPKPTISTLDLTHVGPRDLIDTSRYPIDYRSTTNICISTADGALIPFSLHGNHRTQPGERYDFPSDCRGYLYFHHGDNRAPAGIRFRTSQSGVSPADGDDLLIDPQTVWCIPSELLDPSPSSSNQGLARLALDEGCLPANHQPTPGLRSITSMDQSFIMPFSQAVTFYIPRHGSRPLKRIFRPFGDTRESGRTVNYRTPKYPWKGSAICRLEPMVLGGSLTQAVLRVVKILERPQCIIDGYDGYVPIPTEGSLISCEWGWTPVVRPFPANAVGIRATPPS